MRDPILEQLIKLQQRLDTFLARIDELDRLFRTYIALTQADKTGVPPLPPSSVN